MTSNRSPKRPSTHTRFQKAPQADIGRSTFDLSRPYKTTFDSGKLIPLPPIEVLPGDTHKLSLFAFARTATPIHPTMDNLHLSSFFFFVPNRLVWDNWEKFMGEQDNPADSTDFTVPVRTAMGAQPEQELLDYMGIPPGIAGYSVQALPIRGHNLIWNDWFRDENLQDSLIVDTSDGPDSSTVAVQRRGKRRDYFSSALPWPQKGPGVDLPLGTTAPIIVDTDIVGTEVGIRNDSDALVRLGASAANVTLGTTGAGTELFADLTNATAATINDLRQAFQIQKLQERDARGGTRYVELLKSHFGVTSPDFRLQRPEYLGGGQSPIQMQTVPQTSSTDATTPQANLSGYGTATISGHKFTYSAVEHGYIHLFVQVRADLTYQQGIERHWSRSTKYDFYWPALQAIGEQSVLNKEIFADASANDDLIWGYQERWAEYRWGKGQVTGKFRTNATATLDPWHYAQDFQVAPVLNDTYIQDTPPVKRTIAVQTEPEFLFDAWIQHQATRPMPVYSVPGYIDHF